MGIPSSSADSAKMLLPAGNDYFIKQLLEFDKRRVWTILFIILLISILPIIASCFDGSFFNKNLKVDAFRDLGYHTQFLLMLPFFVFFLPYYFNGLQKAINKLLETKVLKMSDSRYKEAIEYSNSLFSHWSVTYLPLIVAVSFTIFGIFNYFLGGFNKWNSATDINDLNVTDILAILPLFPFYYFITAIILRIGLTHFVIKNIFNGSIEIEPLHPDNCGGLSPLGEFSLRASYTGIGVGIPVVILIIFNTHQPDSLNNKFYIVMNIVTYVVGLTTVFFLPLLGARASMLKAKREELKRISELFQKERISINMKIDSNNSSQDIDFTRIQGLINLYEMAKSMPVYPFEATNVLRFFGGVLWPILLILAQIVLEKI
jgi:hypothetical protein